MQLTGGALRRLEEITPAGMTARLDVTLTDEPPIAQAVVIITAVPVITGRRPEIFPQPHP
jgi:holo-[acyl-carrier protein] synthase